MTPRINYSSSFLIIILLLLLLSAGTIESSGVGTNCVGLLHKQNSRKLLRFDAVLDYDYAGPNPKHDPRGKKGGGGSKGP